MSKYQEIGDNVYFWFAANTTAGAAGDGATPLFDVRLAGAAADAAPTASGTPTLLTHANYSDGLYEILVDTDAFAAGEYAVFCTLTISTVNPAGFVGSFKLRTAGTAALSVHTLTIATDAVNAAAVAADALAEINAQVDTALTDIHLDHLLATDYDPASKPGTATALLNELVESDAGVSRLTANALEQAPTGGSAPTAATIADAVWDEVRADHVTAGTFGDIDTTADIAAAVWTEALPGSYGAGTAGLAASKANYLPAATAGAAGGVFIAGANAATSITNASGSALTLTSTGGNGHGLLGVGHGTGSGLTGAGGGTDGHGIYAAGDAGGMGIYAVGGDGTVSSGMMLSSQASISKYGLYVEDGALITNDAGVGLAVMTSGTDQHGMTIAGNGTGNDLVADITGNLSGTVGTVTTLTNLPAVPTDWLTAAGVKADAVTKVQTGLATPTNITAGTITTVTNLTNAPTSGDLTATMKTSVTTAATAATPTAALAASAIDAILDEVVETQGSITLRQAAQILIAALAGVTADADTSPILFKTPNGSRTTISCANDGTDRTSITLTFS